MAFGAFYINGLQTGIPGGNQTSLGPFAVPFTGCQDVFQQVLSVGANTVTVPTATVPGGLWIIPPNGSTVTLQLPGGLYIDPQSETFVNFDNTTPHVPASIVITAGGTVTVVFQFT